MSDVILLATRKGLLTFHCRSGRWSLVRESFVGVRATYATVDPRSGVLWACLDHGHWGVKLHRSPDLGETWKEIPAPKYPEGAVIKEEKPASTQYLWTLAPGGVDQHERLYLGTIPGGLFISDDGGETWSLNEPLWNHASRETWFGGGFDEAGIHSVVVDPRDAQHVQLGISVAGMFETTDGGETWTPKNKGCRADFLPDPDVDVGHDPHALVACSSQPDVLWQQNHCGIFRSTDGGGHWSEVSPDDGPAGFGFAIACDPDDALAAWVVPAESDEQRVAVDRALCVCRTSDGGATWSVYREGLPQEHCYDFVFRHGLDLSGEQMVMGTAGGSAYVSDDRGETWQALGKHFAPVYSARFA